MNNLHYWTDKQFMIKDKDQKPKPTNTNPIMTHFIIQE